MFIYMLSGTCGLEIIERVVEGRWPYLRPLLCPQSHSDEMGQLMQRCWSEDVNERPDFNQIKVLLRKNNRYLKHKSSHKQILTKKKLTSRFLVAIFCVYY